MAAAGGAPTLAGDAGPRIPAPFAPPLENEVRISPAKIIAAAKAALI